MKWLNEAICWNRSFRYVNTVSLMTGSFYVKIFSHCEVKPT